MVENRAQKQELSLVEQARATIEQVDAELEADMRDLEIAAAVKIRDAVLSLVDSVRDRLPERLAASRGKATFVPLQNGGTASIHYVTELIVSEGKLEVSSITNYGDATVKKDPKNTPVEISEWLTLAPKILEDIGYHLKRNNPREP